MTVQEGETVALECTPDSLASSVSWSHSHHSSLPSSSYVSTNTCQKRLLPQPSTAIPLTPSFFSPSLLPFFPLPSLTPPFLSPPSLPSFPPTLHYLSLLPPLPQVLPSGTLVVENTTSFDGGTYMCIYTTSNGSILAYATASVTVMGKPNSYMEIHEYSALAYVQVGRKERQPIQTTYMNMRVLVH